MAGNTTLAGYESAYNESHKGGGGIIPGSALAAADTAGQRDAAGMAMVPAEKERAREASDVLWKLHKYQEITCSCGLKFKIPPDFHSNTFACPRCGTVHNI
jgi:hypothetical protein